MEQSNHKILEALENNDTSLYGRYIKERENKYIIEDEIGFVTFKFESDYCYIVDLYVLPEHRKSHVASSYADKVAEIAKKAGYDKLLGTVSPQANKSTESIEILIAYGFKLLQSDHNLLYFTKEI